MAAGRLKIDIRRKRILELLAQNGQVTVTELSELLNATQTTIRTDLDTMAAENRLVRIPGGAIAIPAQPVQTPVQEAAPDALAAQKRAIAAKVLSHIQDGDTLFLNSGSTTLRVAEALCARKRLCVVTNSIRAAEVLAGYPETHVVLLGGEINAIYGFTFGDDAVQQLGRYQPAWAILSVDGVNAVQGITTYHAEEAMVNRIMIQQAHQVIVAADRRKVGRAGFTGICRLDDRFTVITDSGAKPEELDEIRATGAAVEVAEETKLRPGWVLALLCTVLFFYGFYLGGVQLVISGVSREYGQNAAGMGGLVAAQHVAAVVLPVVLGALADRIGKKPVLCIFAAVFAAGCFLAGLSKNLGVYVIGAVCVGAGYSVCESVSSAVLSELDAEKGARYINLSQALLSLGAVVSPFLVQWLQKSRHASWRLPFLICAAAYTLLALLLLLTVFPKRQTVTQREAKARTNFFASRAFRLLFFSILLYVGLENGISYFAESLFSVRLSAGDLAAAAISAYWIGMTVSRMLFSAVLRNPKKTLVGCFLASAAFLLALAVSKHPTVSLVCCFAAGFSYGPIWSTLVAQATGLFPEAGAGAAGVMSAGCGIGGIVYPVLMGAACDGMGLGGAFGLLAATAAAGAVLCARLQTNKRKTGASAPGMQ